MKKTSKTLSVSSQTATSVNNAPEPIINAGGVQMTKQGFDTLKAELEELVHVTRQQVIENLQIARAQGDLSENAEYDIARERQATVEQRISEIENILLNAQIIEQTKSFSVVVGVIVTIEDLATKKHQTIQLVNAVEADPFLEVKKIAITTKIGEALIGKRENDVISFYDNKNKLVQYKIHKIKT